MSKRHLMLAGLLLSASSAAQAEVVSAGPNGFEVQHNIQMVAPPATVYAAFGRIQDWWGKDHTYSGDSSNLRLTLVPGGCFCERLPGGGGIEHLRVAYVVPGERIVMSGSLGPLLYEATAGVMDIQFKRIAGGTRVTMNYRAAGFALGGAEKLAPKVDEVLGAQMKRFRAFAVARPRSN